MRRFLAAAVTVLAAAGLSPAGSALAAAPVAPETSEPAAVPGQLLVGYQRGASEAHRADARGRAQAELVDTVVQQGAGGAVELVRFKGSDRAAAARRFTSNPNVAFAEPNWIYTHSDVAVDDPLYTDGSLWGAYGNVVVAGEVNQYGSQAAEAWAAGNAGDSDVYVGIIDEGYQFDHPDLVGNVATVPLETDDGIDNDGNGYIDDVYGWDFEGGDNSIYDGAVDDHGTHVAGTIGATRNNGLGVAGVAGNVKLLSAKFLGVNGGTTANAILAVDYFTDLKLHHGVNIVATNNSWSGGGYSEGLRAAIARAGAADIAFVAAAGNSGRNNDTSAVYPANYDVPNVISVAAIDKYGAKASFSNYGARTVDLGAPGVGIWSTLPGGSYGAYNGTSMAAPHVTGAVALYAAASPGATVATVKRTILHTAVPTAALAGKTVTGGRLNAGQFVAPPPPLPVPSATVAFGAKKKTGTPVTLRWSGFVGSNVDVYRGTNRIATANDGLHTETVKSGSLTYQVCETWSGVCTPATVL